MSKQPIVSIEESEFVEFLVDRFVEKFPGDEFFVHPEKLYRFWKDLSPEDKEMLNLNVKIDKAQSPNTYLNFFDVKMFLLRSENEGVSIGEGLGDKGGNFVISETQSSDYRKSFNSIDKAQAHRLKRKFSWCKPVTPSFEVSQMFGAQSGYQRGAKRGNFSGRSSTYVSQKRIMPNFEPSLSNYYKRPTLNFRGNGNFFEDPNSPKNFGQEENFAGDHGGSGFSGYGNNFSQPNIGARRKHCFGSGQESNMGVNFRRGENSGQFYEPEQRHISNEHDRERSPEQALIVGNPKGEIVTYIEAKMDIVFLIIYNYYKLRVNF